MSVDVEVRAVWLARHILLHEPALRAWLRRRDGVDEIDDVVQETYAVLAGLAGVDHILRPKAYMFQVAHSIVIERLRRARIVRIDAMGEIEELTVQDDTASPERIASDRQELRRVAVLIATLPDRCRQTFILRKIEGLSQREIAQRLGVSEGTVEKQLTKGVRLLMDALARSENDTQGVGGRESGRSDGGGAHERTDRRRRR